MKLWLRWLNWEIAPPLHNCGKHSRIAFEKVYQITENEAEAEDVIQEAWMKAFVHFNKFDERAKFSTWQARIAINSALMVLRRRRSRPEAPIEFTDGEKLAGKLRTRQRTSKSST
jgi:RNA polymerase sigma factor (sigma-70 family)